MLRVSSHEWNKQNNLKLADQVERNNEEGLLLEICFLDQRAQWLQKANKIMFFFKQLNRTSVIKMYSPNTNPVIPIPLVAQANIKRPSVYPK